MVPSGSYPSSIDGGATASFIPDDMSARRLASPSVRCPSSSVGRYPSSMLWADVTGGGGGGPSPGGGPSCRSAEKVATARLCPCSRDSLRSRIVSAASTSDDSASYPGSIAAAGFSSFLGAGASSSVASASGRYPNLLAEKGYVSHHGRGTKKASQPSQDSHPDRLPWPPCPLPCLASSPPL